MSSLNRSTKTLLKDFKTDMASSVKATLSNISRRFEKIKSTLPHRHLLMKQIVPHLEAFERGYEEEMNWIMDALGTLDSCRKATTLEEVESELKKYKVSILYSIFCDSRTKLSSANVCVGSKFKKENYK